MRYSLYSVEKKREEEEENEENGGNEPLKYRPPHVIG